MVHAGRDGEVVGIVEAVMLVTQTGQSFTSSFSRWLVGKGESGSLMNLSVSSERKKNVSDELLCLLPQLLLLKKEKNFE